MAAIARPLAGGMMMQDPMLVLRDIHQPPAPPWWPPAPGWWIVAAITLLVLAIGCWLAARRRRHRQAIACLFDEAMQAAQTPAAQVAAMSQLLRRAARRHDRDADKLQGEAWLQFLDRNAKQLPLTQDEGRLLLEGGFHRELDPQQVAALLLRGRARFLELMRVRVPRKRPAGLGQLTAGRASDRKATT